MRCVAVNEFGAVVDVVPQPATIDACTMVIAPGSAFGSPDLAALGITPDVFASVVMVAFALVVGAWAFGWAASAAFSAVRRF